MITNWNVTGQDIIKFKREKCKNALMPQELRSYSNKIIQRRYYRTPSRLYQNTLQQSAWNKKGHCSFWRNSVTPHTKFIRIDMLHSGLELACHCKGWRTWQHFWRVWRIIYNILWISILKAFFFLATILGFNTKWVSL